MPIFMGEDPRPPTKILGLSELSARTVSHTFVRRLEEFSNFSMHNALWILYVHIDGFNIIL